MKNSKYKILVKFLGSNDWEDEKFLTGGTIYHSYKDAIEIKRKCQDLSSLKKYKVIKLIQQK